MARPLRGGALAASGLTGVRLAAHADVAVVGHLGRLVVRGLVLLRHLGVLLRQEGHRLRQVSIAHL